MGAVNTIIFFAFLVASLATSNAEYKTCAKRDVSPGTVCVCTIDYCDSTPQVRQLGSTSYQLITTSQGNLGFYEKNGTFSNQKSEDLFLNIVNFDVSNSVEILGFGGAFTDATGENIGSLSPDLQSILIDSYFGQNGIEYTFGRVPIGGTDFSPRGYTNCDIKDETLNSFLLQQEDLVYKIKHIKAAQKVQPNLTLLGSAWSAPVWMKTNDDLFGKGSLKEEYYDLWAQYYIKWFEAYKQQGVDFWGVTVHNEGFTADERINNMVWNYTSQNKWIVNSFGPQIRKSEFKDLNIMLLDDNRYLLHGLQENTLNNPDVMKYADGIAVHWYSDSAENQDQLNYAKSDIKELFVLATEGSNYIYPPGSWDYAVKYFYDVMIDLKHNLSGWIDWNLVVDTTGGPSWRQAALGAPITVNTASNFTDEFHKHPTYYIMGHFSKYVTPGSKRIQIIESSDFASKNLTSIGFLRPDRKVVLMVSNENDQDLTLGVNFLSLSTSEMFTFEKHSINTLIYNV